MTDDGLPAGLRRGVALTADASARLPDTEASAPSLRAGGTPSPLGLSLMREAGQRLGRASLMLSAGGLIAVFVWFLSIAVGWRTAEEMIVTIIVGPVILGASLAMFVLARSERLHPSRLLDVGLAYQVAGALGLSILIFWNADGPPKGMTRVPWLCVWLVVFPLVVPARPRRSIVASCLSALTAPVVLGVWVAVGNQSPTTRELFYLLVPVAFCLGLSVVPTLVVYRLGTRVTEVERELRRLGRWVLVELIGQGGMGDVWKARHAVIARPAAVKVIRNVWMAGGPLVDRATALVRFEREARAISALACPHTVELYDYGVADDGSLYFAMELLPGLDLETLVRGYGPVPPARVVHVLRQVCSSLSEAHDAGLVHRDVKPANVIVSDRGLDHDFAKVLDFGLVKVMERGRGSSDGMATADGEVVGTGAFMAPEMAAGMTDVDARADIYGIGCLAYWLLTGKTVFDVDGGVSILYAHMRTAPVPPSERAGVAIPAELERLVLQCLEKEREKRPPSARALADQLAECDLDGDRWTATQAERWWRERPVLTQSVSSTENPTEPYAGPPPVD